MFKCELVSEKKESGSDRCSSDLRSVCAIVWRILWDSPCLLLLLLLLLLFSSCTTAFPAYISCICGNKESAVWMTLSVR